ncbi:MAG TPA: DUF177 domain-containing protein [bacterium]|nr:DUF177 domain-containing protein [bacterium]HPJ71219.1 DUF177 domain-containing protein [bacterium]HPQ66093.1 DUF177 domain-containing protein [bacterium]
MTGAKTGLSFPVWEIGTEGIVTRGAADPELLGELDPGTAVASPIEYDFALTRAGKMVLARGKVAVRSRFQCSRCLKEYESDVVEPEVFAEFTVTSPEQIIDLTGIVREYTILAFPVKPLCSEECRGLCPSCGRNLNLGPCGCSGRVPDSPFAVLE